MLPKYLKVKLVSRAALLPLSRLALVDHVDEVVSQHKRHSLALEAELLLEVAEDVAEVYVEELGRRKHGSILATLGLRIESSNKSYCALL